ncbi:hypothetical protein [Methanogenium cariaci]
MNRHMLFLAAALSIVLVLACAGCSELPADERDVRSGGENGETAAPTATPNWVQEATPIRTPEPVVTTPPVAPEPELPVYTEIYSNKVYLLYDVIALNYDLKVPAMMIDLEIDPDMVADTNEKYSDYGSKKLITVKKSYPDPRADLIVTIFDRTTGDIVEEYDFEQFNQEHEEQTITLRYPGLYQIELEGNNVDVGITITVPEANVVDGEEPFPVK